MGVARETLVSVLRDMGKLEEIESSNIKRINQFDFSEFGPSLEKTIRYLLNELERDTGQHKKIILDVIDRLNDEKKGQKKT